MRNDRRIPPEPGQESVWDYPRPPRVEPTGERVVVKVGGVVVADTTRAVRVLETSHPPVYYLPREDFADGALQPARGASFCEFKGYASYLHVVGGARPGRRVRADRAAWCYDEPSPGYEALRGYVAVYPGAVDECTVDGEPVEAQTGDYYGGWITWRVVGPFKGGSGTASW